MKKSLSIFLLILLIIASTTVNATSMTDDVLNTSINNINNVLENKEINPTNPNYITEILDANGNVPSYQYYPNHIDSRAIKVLKEYDRKIFMGLGDWNDNTGPVKMIYYDTVDETIKTSGTIADEAVERFTIVDNKLYTTGCDPRANWGYGSYYVYNKQENKWEQHLKNNGWVHVFDVIEFKDKLFMYGETTGNQYSHIQYSEDGGETFKNTKIFYNETDVTHYVDFRCQNMASYNGKLYAYFMLQNGSDTYRGIYLYDENNNQFNYYSNIPYPRTIGIPYPKTNYYRMKNIIFNNEFIYISGTVLYRSTDLKEFTEIPSDIGAIREIILVGDTLYTLSYTYNEDKSFATKISSTKDLVNFNLIYEFTTDTLPYAIEYYNNSFYVGTAYGTSSTCKDSSKNGSLYRIDLDKAKTYLSIDKNNETVTIFDDGQTYGVEYDLSSEKSVFKTTLEFDNTMTQRQWEEEYSKIENLKLMFATIADSKNINFNASTTYFNNVLSNNIPETSKTYVTATEYAQDMFKEELNIQDELFNITTAKISETQDEYKTLVTLTINKDSDFSALEPNDGKEDNNNNENSNDNSQTNNNTQTNGKNPVTNPNTQVNDYINNNNKLPQTGEFFGVKNILKVIRITAIVALVAIFITKKNKTRNNRRKR